MKFNLKDKLAGLLTTMFSTDKVNADSSEPELFDELEAQISVLTKNSATNESLQAELTTANETVATLTESINSLTTNLNSLSEIVSKQDARITLAEESFKNLVDATKSEFSSAIAKLQTGVNDKPTGGEPIASTETEKKGEKVVDFSKEWKSPEFKVSSH